MSGEPSQLNSRPKRRTEEDTKAIVKELNEQFAAGVEQQFHGSGYADYLHLMRTSNNYSAYNLMLAMMQLESATMLRGYKSWQRIGRQVKKGEVGATIYAPIMRTKTEKDEHGKEVKRRVLTGFRLTKTFDVSQTEGDPLPDPIVPGYLEGQAPHNMWESLARRVKHHGYALQVARLPQNGPEGVTYPRTKTMVVSDQFDHAQMSSILSHELGHVELGHVDDWDTYRTHRGESEIAAESFAYVVSGLYGLDSSATSVPYVLGWSQDAKDIRRVADKVMKAVRELVAFTPELQEIQPKDVEQGSVKGDASRALERGIA